MGFFNKNKTDPQKAFRAKAVLENFYDQPIQNPSWDQVDKYIRKMMETSEEHVLLKPDVPSASGVAFMQAASEPGGYDLQIGLSSEAPARLLRMHCDENTVFTHFYKFFHESVVEDIEKFQPVPPKKQKTYSAGPGKPPIWVQPIIEEGKMFDQDFFYFTNMLDWGKKDPDAVLEPLVDFLAKYGDNVIFAFDDKMAELLYNLDTRKIASPFLDSSKYFSPDGFLYARCLALVNGRSYYNAILSGKKKLPTDKDFEDILYVAETAWLRIHLSEGGTYTHRTRFCYETYSNEGGWKEQNGGETK